MPTPYYNSKLVVKILVEYIKLGKTNQSDLAKKLDVSQAAISHWVKGKTGPTPDNIDKIKSVYPEIEAILNTLEGQSAALLLSPEEGVIESVDANTQIEVLKERINSLMTEVTLKNTIIESMEREISTLRGWLREHQDRSQKRKSNHDALDGGNI